MATPPKFIHDHVGFPMIRVAALDAYIHWLPVSKLQIETFLCGTPPPGFDAAWYESILALNSRVAPPRIDAGNYWQAFVGGVRPAEAMIYAEWSGRQSGSVDSLPTDAEWSAAFGEVRRSAEVDVSDLAELSPPGRVRQVLLKVQEALDDSPARGADLGGQMLMRFGLMEWVRCPGSRGGWGGLGQPNPRFQANLSNPETGRAAIAIDADGVRRRTHGFRLLRRTAAP